MNGATLETSPGHPTVDGKENDPECYKPQAQVRERRIATAVLAEFEHASDCHAEPDGDC